MWYGEDDVRPGAHPDAAARVDPALGQLVEFAEELDHIQHDAVAEQAPLPGVQHARGDLVQDDVLVPDVHRVPRVGAPLIARDDVDVAGQHVDDLALALVTPLAAYNDRAGSVERARVHRGH